ncbi:flagellar motor protein MotB [Massilia yuzhufengensis]|uniref:Chemotaxis protein MotB n=1 Tax=Massilia yuzhufengensis TaxID=1164594 RepID=A0A1I1G2K0_9BURK|nr:flagellar motor protein MotB [Massilia yuzhufengensis]SFC05741.1 chemotaxis protein MotB [Massilia yuzhufengensis]
MSKPNEKHESTIVKRGGGKHAHDEHGGAWKVAFADFCLALMALFLVLWLIASREQQNLKKIVRDATDSGMLEGLGNKPAVASEPSGSLIERFELPISGNGGNAGDKGPGTPSAPRVAYESPAELAALSKALGEMSQEAGLAANLDTVITPYGLRVMLHDTERQGMFMRGSALPTGRFVRLLGKMGPLFAQMKNQMLIVGHTDASRFAGSDKGGYSNWALSTDRALSARRELLDGGMRSDSVLQVVGMADRAPLEIKEPLAGVNRRIELMILTTAQSRMVSAMFGKPGAMTPLGKDASISVPDAAALEKLRSQLPR